MGTDGRKPYADMAGRLQPQLLEGINQMQYSHMTPVQEKVLALKDFTSDCLVQAKTGTGKTLAFLLPTLHTLIDAIAAKTFQVGRVGILIIAPTRELAAQIGDECNKLTALCKPPIECHLAVGGSNKASSLAKFLKGRPSVLVSTPGRLLDYLSDDSVRHKFSSIRSLILDEADSLLDSGFFDDLLKIIHLLPTKASAKWQGMCFSATMPNKINEVLHHVLKPNCPRISTISETEAPTVDTIPQSLIPVEGIEAVLPTLHTLLTCELMDNPGLKAVIFTHTARNAGLLYQLFATEGVAPVDMPVFQMHSRMSQPARNKTVDQFKDAERGLLFASDVVGRGMDFPDVALVVQIGLPMNSEQYVHRVGRTGRAGKVGRAVILLIPEEMVFIRKNPQFPIKNTGLTYPKASTVPSSEVIENAISQLPDQSKEQAYVAFLGYVKTHGRLLGMAAPAMVKLANRFSEALGCEEPPELEASTIGKMGLKGVPGLHKKAGPGKGGRGGNAFGGANPGRGGSSSGFGQGRGGDDFGGPNPGRGGGSSGFGRGRGRGGGATGAGRGRGGNQPAFGFDGASDETAPAPASRGSKRNASAVSGGGGSSTADANGGLDGADAFSSGGGNGGQRKGRQPNSEENGRKRRGSRPAGNRNKKV